MPTAKAVVTLALLIVVVVAIACIEIGILGKSPGSLYIWEGPFGAQSKTNVPTYSGESDTETESNVEQVRQVPIAKPTPETGVPRIALLVPGRSLAGWTIRNIPLLQLFLPTLLETITKEELRDFDYAIYFGCDDGDPLYDNDENISELYDIFREKSEVRLHMFSFSNTQGKPVLVWNRLFEKAFEDGCHYFYQVNDDVRFITSGWSREFVDALRRNRVFPDLGVTGPKDIGSAILTQSFVSRIHMHIFGYFYPPLFDNWYSDDWMTHVYDDASSAFGFQSFLIKNDNSQGTRYDVDYKGGESLDVLLRNGRVAVREFLETHAPGSTIYSDPIHKDSERRYPSKRGSQAPGDSITNQSTNA